MDKLFHTAANTGLYPPLPLFEHSDEELVLTARYSRALHRIFLLLDKNRDGILEEEGILRYQKICQPKADPSVIRRMKEMIASASPEGIEEGGINLMGFMMMHHIFIHQVKFKPLWILLRYYGYDNQLKLSDDFLLPDSQKPGSETGLGLPDQGLAQLGTRHELSLEGIAFVKEIFHCFAGEGGLLEEKHAEELYRTTTGDPFLPDGDSISDNSSLLSDLLPATDLYPVNESQFILMWRLCTLLHCQTSFKYFRMLGHLGNLEGLFHSFPFVLAFYLPS